MRVRSNRPTRKERARSEALFDSLAESLRGVVDVGDGYRLTFAADPVVFTDLAECATLERRCCPFLSFALEWHSGEGMSPSITLTGPAGVKEFLDAQLPVERPQG